MNGGLFCPQENLLNKRLFIGNLSFDVSETQLRDAFAQYGATAATIPNRWSRSDAKADRPKGFGYVDVPEALAAAAIAGMQGSVLDGRAIDVHEAKPRPDLQLFGGRRPEGRGYGGGGYGGDRGGGGGGGRFAPRGRR